MNDKFNENENNLLTQRPLTYKEVQNLSDNLKRVKEAQDNPIEGPFAVFVLIFIAVVTIVFVVGALFFT